MSFDIDPASVTAGADLQSGSTPCSCGPSRPAWSASG